jgi:hypothetical protein
VSISMIMKTLIQIILLVPVSNLTSIAVASNSENTNNPSKSTSISNSENICDDGVDNNNDGSIDCTDSD